MVLVDGEQSLFAANGAHGEATEQQVQWRMVEAPLMTLRELYSRFGAAAAATAPAPAAAPPAPAPTTVPTAQITVQQPGRASTKSVGWGDVGAKGDTQADVEAGAPPTGGGGGKAASRSKPAVEPLSKKMKIALWVAVVVLVVCGCTAIGLAATQGAKGGSNNSSSSGGGGSSSSGSSSQQADAAAAAEVPAATEESQAPAPSSSDPAAAPFQVPDGSKALWWDEFDGSQLDTSRWMYDTAAQPESGQSEGVQTYTDSPDNVWLADSKLHIRSLRSQDGGSYTSGRLNSKPSGAWYPGMSLPDGSKVKSLHVEASIQPAQPGQGIASAFVAAPVELKYGKWPASGEIDIMGATGDKKDVSQGIRYGQPWPNNEEQVVKTAAKGDPWSAGFATYALEWRRDRITLSINGERSKAISSWWSNGGNSSKAPFDQPFSLVLNVAVGGSWAGAPDGSTPAEATMRVDYVRVWAELGDGNEEEEEAARAAEEARKQKEKEEEARKKKKQEEQERKAKEEKRRAEQERKKAEAAAKKAEDTAKEAAAAQAAVAAQPAAAVAPQPVQQAQPAAQAAPQPVQEAQPAAQAAPGSPFAGLIDSLMGLFRS